MKLKIGAAFAAFAIFGGVGLMALSAGPGPASAAPVTITFSWWVTNTTTGTVVGTTAGALGSGTLTGQFLAYNAGPPATSTIQYTLNGSAHSMTIMTSGKDAEVTGDVSDGWLKGQKVTGSVIAADACSQGADGKCYTTQLTADDPSAAAGAPGAAAPGTPAAGTGLAPVKVSSRLTFFGAILVVAGAAGLFVTMRGKGRRTTGA